MTAGGVFGRLVATAFLSGAFYILHALISAPATLITGQMAGRQFENSDSAFLQTQAVFGGFAVLNMLMSIAFAVFLVLIWWRYIKLGWSAMMAGAVALMLLTGSPQDAQAFFEKTDRTEIYTILPNESAFWIPDVGDNKTTQAQMDSEAYLNANKIAANDEMIEMMDAIEKNTKEYFTSVGITTDFIGWGDTFEFDKDIQKSVNSRYIAIQDRKNADLLKPVEDTIKALAAANAQRSFGEKTDGRLPTTFFGSAPDISAPVLGLPGLPGIPRPAVPAPTQSPQ